jgi:hypothetical protein
MDGVANGGGIGRPVRRLEDLQLLIGNVRYLSAYSGWNIDTTWVTPPSRQVASPGPDPNLTRTRRS